VTIIKGLSLGMGYGLEKVNRVPKRCSDLIRNQFKMETLCLWASYPKSFRDNHCMGWKINKASPKNKKCNTVIGYDMIFSTLNSFVEPRWQNLEDYNNDLPSFSFCK